MPQPQPSPRQSKSKFSSKPKAKPAFPPLPPHFVAKKSQILSTISVPTESYTDKSPKGSIDAPIIDLINELNAIDGVVTTSSCSGRVAVFVEGRKTVASAAAGTGSGTGEHWEGEGSDAHADEDEDGDENEAQGEGAGSEILTGSPAGKGGGHWLYVSHDPVDIPDSVPAGFFTRLCGLSTPATALPPSSRDLKSGTSAPSAAAASSNVSSQSPRLIKLAFSPLILHFHVATLQHAKPLLSAAISAGFRESGVQSLKALDDPDVGSTVGIRTAGLGFEAVVGIVREQIGDNGIEIEEVYESMVSEEFLGTMFEVINERFEWNLRRKERFRREVSTAFALDGGGGMGREWEDKEVRRNRMREEGLRRRKDKELMLNRKEMEGERDVVEVDNLTSGNEEVAVQYEDRNGRTDTRGEDEEVNGQSTLGRMFANKMNL